MPIKAPETRDYLLLSILSIIFGGSFILTNLSVQSISPLTVVASRLCLAAAMLYPIMRYYKQRLPAPGRIWIFITASAFFGNALPFGLISWGQVSVDAGLTAILMAIMPLITVLLAHMVTSDEKMNRYKLIGVFFGLAGVVVLMGWDKLGSLGNEMVRQYAIAAGAICYSVNAIVTKYLTDIPKLSMMTALLVVGSVMMLPLSLLFEHPWTLTPTVSSVASIVGLAIGPTAIATLMILVITQRQGASFLSQINFMVPLAGIVMARFFLGELLPTSAWLALFLILLGIAVSRVGAGIMQKSV